MKQQITLRLDADVVAWLRKHGKGYQTKTNSMLREIMMKRAGGHVAPRKTQKVTS